MRSVRTVRRWHKEERAGLPRPKRGRPPATAGARLRALREVCREFRRQTSPAGEAAIFAAVAERGVTRRQVRDALRRLKRRRLRRAARVAAAHRTSVQPLATNALVGQDATFCGRDDEGNKRWAEVQRDVASTKTVGLACGPDPGATPGPPPEA